MTDGLTIRRFDGALLAPYSSRERRFGAGCILESSRYDWRRAEGRAAARLRDQLGDSARLTTGPSERCVLSGGQPISLPAAGPLCRRAGITRVCGYWYRPHG